MIQVVDLYTAPTTDGHKASYIPEALKIRYDTHFVKMSDGHLVDSE